MTQNEELLHFIKQACCGNIDAENFLKTWYVYCHAVDDLIDGDVPAEEIKEWLIRLLYYSKELYSSTFYLTNIIEFYGVIDAVVNAYADSIKWEGADKPWCDIANVIRSQGNDVALVTAKLCGGYEHMRAMSLTSRQMSFKHQNTDS